MEKENLAQSEIQSTHLVEIPYKQHGDDLLQPATLNLTKFPFAFCSQTLMDSDCCGSYGSFTLSINPGLIYFFQGWLDDLSH